MCDFILVTNTAAYDLSKNFIIHDKNICFSINPVHNVTSIHNVHLFLSSLDKVHSKKVTYVNHLL